MQATYQNQAGVSNLMYGVPGIARGILLASCARVTDAADYFPPPESVGGWRTLDSAEDIRRIAGMDPTKLDTLKRWLLESDKRDFAAVAVRRGYLVLEVERGHNAKLQL